MQLNVTERIFIQMKLKEIRIRCFLPPLSIKLLHFIPFEEFLIGRKSAFILKKKQKIMQHFIQRETE